VLSFREKLFRHVQRLSLSYHDTRGTADSAYRIQYDALAIKDLVIESIVPTISASFMLIGMIYVTARLNLRLALVAMAISPVLLAITWYFSGRLRKRWREVKKLESSAQSVVQEVLSSVRVVKAFSREEHEHGRFLSSYNRGLAARLRVALQENLYNVLIGLTVACGTVAVLAVGVMDVRSGRPDALTLGDLLLVMAYIKQLYEPLKTMGKRLASKQGAVAGAERAFDLLDELPEVHERPNARPITRARGAVAFENVTFAYDGGNPAVMRQVSFRVEPGCRVGIVGKTGAGKTTLVNLLTRFYDPQGGRILLDDVDLSDYRLADLRNQFSIVLQEPVLFSTSVAENIAYGRPGATRDEIVAAARAANAHDFIEKFPDGYDTTVGERGMRLSGGERQRISLARAFLRDAPILILDEPTSSVDTATEGLIMQAMQRLMSNRTTFMIAHRLGTLAGCDVLLRVVDGNVVCDRNANPAAANETPGPEVPTHA